MFMLSLPVKRSGKSKRALVAGTLLGLLAAPSIPAAPADHRPITAVVNTRVLVRPDRPAVSDAVVVVQGGWIVAAARRENVAVPRNATVLDGSGLVVLRTRTEADPKLLAAGQAANILLVDDFPEPGNEGSPPRYEMREGQWIGTSPPAFVATAPRRPRWQNLPHTNTSFVPRRYTRREDWEKKRDLLRSQIAWAAGFAPQNTQAPPRPTVLDRRERDGYTVENVYFESRPGLFVSGNLYRPQNPRRRAHPGILSPHGHWGQGRLHDDDKGSIQARCVTLARLGCVAFAWDMLGYNDSARQLDGKYVPDSYWGPHNRAWKHGRDRRTLWNVNSLGVQLLNSSRALDFLAALPEVDPERLAATGCSGGGTQIFLLAALDQRVRVAAPVCMISAYMQGGCTCENAAGLRIGTHNVEFGALMAPRPLLMISATTDWTARTPVVEFPAIREIYALYGATDKVAEAQFEAQHGYNLAMRETAYPWLSRWLGFHCPPDFREPSYTAEPPETLLSFGGDIPARALRSHEELIESLIDDTRRATERLSPTTSTRLRRNRELLGQGFTLSVGAGELHVRDLKLELEADGTRTLGAARIRGGVLVETRRGLRIPIARVVAPNVSRGESSNCVLVIDKDGIDTVTTDPDGLSRLLRNGSTLYAMDPFDLASARGPEDLTGRTQRPPYFTTFNRTDDAERIYDIVAAILFCAARGTAPESGTAGPATLVTVIGRGRAGPLTAIAGAIARQLLPSAPLALAYPPTDVSVLSPSMSTRSRRPKPPSPP